MDNQASSLPAVGPTIILGVYRRLDNRFESAG